MTPTPLTLPAHPAADLFPLMTEEELVALTADIEAHGQRDPVMVYEGQILDGRNRYAACRRLGIPPLTRRWDGAGSPIDYVLSTNLHRRHLSASQKAAIAVNAEALFAAEIAEQERQRKAEEAKQQAREGGRFGEKPSDRTVERIPQSGDEPGPTPTPAPKARDLAAQAIGVNPHYVTDAKRLKDDAPDLFADVQSGSLTVPEAKRRYEDRTMQAVIELAGDREGKVAAAQTLADWTKAISQTRRILFHTDLEAVFAGLDDIYLRQANDFLRDLQAWVTTFEQHYRRATAPRLRVVGQSEGVS